MILLRTDGSELGYSPPSGEEQNGISSVVLNGNLPWSQAWRSDQPDRSSMMDTESAEQVAKTRALIERTRRELDRLQDDIQSARVVIEQSRRLLSQAEPTSKTG